MGSLPTHSKSTKLIPMRKLTTILCLTLAVLLGSAGCNSVSQRFQNTSLTGFWNVNHNRSKTNWYDFKREMNEYTDIEICEGVLKQDDHISKKQKYGI